MNMSVILSTFLVGCMIAVVMSLLGFVMVSAGVVTSRACKRGVVLLSTLAAALELCLIEKSNVRLGNTVFDVLTLFLVLWFLCLFLLWLGVAFGIKKHNPEGGHEHDFRNSSILPMYLSEGRTSDPQGVNPSMSREEEDLTRVMQVPASAEVMAAGGRPAPHNL